MRRALGVRFLALASASVGCGTHDNATPVAPDARPDAPPLVEGANEVRLHVAGDPLLVSYRNGSFGWGQPAQVDPGVYRLLVDTYYEAIVVCGDDPHVDSELHARAYADGTEDTISLCERTSSPYRETVDMQVVQTARVFMWGGSADETPGPRTFSAQMPRGLHDMIAVDDTYRMAIRRDIDIQSRTTLSPLNFDNEGSAMQQHAINVVGESANETLATSLYLRTNNGSARIDGTVLADRTTLPLYVPPNALLLTGDYAKLFIETFDSDAGTVRWILAPTTTARNDFELPPTIKPDYIRYSLIDDQILHGQWAWLPPFDTFTLSLATDTPVQTTRQQTAVMTRGFVESSGVKAITLSTPPEFKEDWRINPCAFIEDVWLWQRDAEGIWSMTMLRKPDLPCFPTPPGPPL